ncbi:MAG: Rrf2 family transcriptional regulator [Armatimonadetes bacterium]|nr:Rrf2 family transcriptional regulator [Armatimonadota bacterium]
MQHGNQVEWAIHCCAVLAGLPEGRRLSVASLAEFHGVPKAYLAKGLQRLEEAGILSGSVGPKGGYQLAKPAAEISLLDIVLGLEGNSNCFRCTDIRFNNPCLVNRGKGPCLIAVAMRKAEKAYHRELAQTSLADVLRELAETADQPTLERSAEWFAERIR